MKLFEKILMASEDVKSYLVSGKCEKELFDGAVLVELAKGYLEAHTGLWSKRKKSVQNWKEAF